ncbi:MAG: hypothetical protein ACKVU1_00980 [bacterium]
MHSPRRRRRSSVTLVLALAAIALLGISGCGDNDDGFLAPNIPPTTAIVDPILSGEAVTYFLRVSWRGDDPDGQLAGFQIAVDDTAVWRFTSSAESLFAFQTPNCCAPDTTVMPDSSIAIDSVAFGAHTLFVRAVDARGAEDPSPAQISFNATTLIPEAVIVRGPSASGGIGLTPTVVVFGWQGVDIDGWISGYRYKLDDAPWVSVGADCTSVRFTYLSVAGWPGDLSGIHEFTVLAVDNAGAVERAIDTPENFRRWEAADIAPGTLCITSNVMGEICGAVSYSRQVAEGTPLWFSWRADASAYGARVLCYAYSFDGAAFSPCQGRATRFPAEGTWTAQIGSHDLRVRAFDDAGLSVELAFPFDALVIDHGPPNDRRVLYVDDFALGTGSTGDTYPTDLKEEAFWDTLLFGFNSTRFDAELEDDVPTQRIIRSNSTLIWYVDDDSQLERALGPGATPAFLRDYVRGGGNLILCGSIPTAAFAPDNHFDPDVIGHPACPHSPRYTHGGPERSLDWFPAFCDTDFTFVFDDLGIARSFYDETRDDLRTLKSEGVMLSDGSVLPDLTIDSGKRGVLESGTPIFDALGLEQCEQYEPVTLGDPTRDPIPLWRFVDSNGETKRVCAYYWPRTELRGHVLVLGFSPYFFDTLEMQGVFRALLTMFGEVFSSA